MSRKTKTSGVSAQTERRNNRGTVQLNLECTPEAREQLKVAATLANTTLTEFVLSCALREVDKVKLRRGATFNMPVRHPESAFAA
jgi:uncharacterized protein (DUF1778 family)